MQFRGRNRGVSLQDLSSTVMLQVNFSWKITFDTLYTNGFLIRIHSRTFFISSEHNTI